jgi:hypothetical protein
MSIEIDEISSRKKTPAEYAHLYDLDSHVQENEHRDIDEILLMACRKANELHLGRKYAQLNLRLMSQDDQTLTSDEKASLLRQTKGTYFDAASVASYVGGALLNVSVLGEGFGRAFQAGSSHIDRVARSKEETLTHRYQCMRDIVSSHSQHLQAAERDQEQNDKTTDSLIQNSRRQGELILGQ